MLYEVITFKFSPIDSLDLILGSRLSYAFEKEDGEANVQSYNFV